MPARGCAGLIGRAGPRLVPNGLDALAQPPRMVRKVVRHESGNEVIAVVVTRMAPQGQRVPPFFQVIPLCDRFEFQKIIHTMYV